jgi:DNA polymerase-3 subunit beta
MALLTSERTNAVKLDLGKKKLVVSIVNPELGEGREEIKCEGEMEAVSVSFNPNYLLDFLKNNTSETIDFQFNDVLSPGVFKPATQDNYLYFLMPITL